MYLSYGAWGTMFDVYICVCVCAVIHVCIHFTFALFATICIHVYYCICIYVLGGGL